MKHNFFTLFFALVASVSLCAQTSTPFVVWCSGNTTLYFDYGIVPEAGDTYNSQTVTNVWSGMDVTDNYDTPQWKAIASPTCTNVVFLPSFANVFPTTCYQWFSGFQSLTTVDGLNYLNTANVTTMWGMFSTCSSLTSLDLSSLNTTSLTSTGWMFWRCNALETLDLSGFNTANVSVWQGMFSESPSLTTIIVGDEWSTVGAGDANATRDVFYGCTSIRGGNNTTYNASYTNLAYAHVDILGNPGYLTYANREAFVVWCSDNTTLYFDYNKVPEIGDTYNGQTVTNVWSGTAVTATGNTAPAWNSVVKFACTNVEFTPTFANVSPLSCCCWFDGFQILESIEGLNYLNTVSVTEMWGMFSECSSLTSLDVSSFNTANVTSMSSMFGFCIALTSLDVSSFNTENVINMNGMFYACQALTSLDLSSFNTANVTDMNNMFAGCQTLTSLDVSSFNTAIVTNMCGMFDGCQALTSLDVSSFNTANVTNMSAMFFGCRTLSSLDVSSFNTANVTNMGMMFFGCIALTSLDVSSFNTANVTYMGSMFHDCQSLTSLDVSSFNTSNVTDMSGMFAGCQSLTSLDVSSFNTANVTNMCIMFNFCQVLTSLDLSSFNTSNVMDMSYMFFACYALSSLDVSNFNTENVINMNGMFFGCNALTSLDVSSFNTENVTNMGAMFAGCLALTSLDVSSFNTANVTDMSSMFSSCFALTSLDVSSFNTSNVTNMKSMFSNCFALSSLDVSSFNTSNVTDMSGMFASCSALSTLTVSDDWVTANVTSSLGMFESCTKIRGGYGTTFDASHTDIIYAHIDEPGDPGYLTRKIYSITLTDAEAYSLTQDSIFDVATYQKSLDDDRIGKYQSWLVPFDYTLTDEDLDKFHFYRIHMIADSPEPGEGDDTGELWIYLKRLSAGFTLQANMPYVYKPKEAVTDYEFTTLNTTLKARQNGILASTQTMDDIFSFYATYDFTSPSALDPFYYVNIDGGLSLGNESSVVVSPYRWILRVTSKNGSAPAPARSMRFVGEEDVVTNINYIQAVEDGIWYSVDGRRLGTTRPSTRGIYVRNGKKEIIY